MEKQNKKVTYTKDQVIDLVAEALAETVVGLKDHILVIACKFAMKRLDKKLK